MSKIFTTFLLIFLLHACATSKQSKVSNPDFIQANEYARDGLFREAVHFYEKALESTKSNSQFVALEPAIHRNLGMVLLKIADFNRAEIFLTKAAEFYPNDFEVNFYLGETLRAKQNYAKAIFHYQLADKIKPNDAKNLRSLSWSYFKTSFFSESLAVARRLHKLNNTDPQTSVILARTLLKLKRPKSAHKVIQDALKSANKASKPFLLSVRADILFAEGKFQQASSTYALALRENPLLASALYGYGKCRLEQGDKKGAIDYLDKAIKSKPRFAEAHYTLAKVYETVDPKLSIRHYLQFRKLAANDAEFLEKMPEIRDRISFLNRPSDQKSDIVQKSN